MRATRLRATRLRGTTTGLAVAVLTCATVLTAQLPAAAANCAHPKIKVLDTLSSQLDRSGAVFALGKGTIAAGGSGGVPTYWIGDTPVRVPFPAGYTTGYVQAVNKHGLMGGQVSSTATGTEVAFSYKIGAAKATILPGGSYVAGVTSSGVNDDGTIVGDGAYNAPDADNEAIVGLVWPADPTAPAFHLLPYDNTPFTGVTIIPEDIDDNGRIIGQKQDYEVSEAYEMYWDAPYTAPGTQLSGLPGYHSEGYLYGTSPTSGLVAGNAPDTYHSDGPIGTAEIWTGAGSIHARIQ